MEENIDKYQFRKECTRAGTWRRGAQGEHHTLDFLFLPRSFVCLSKNDPRFNAYFSSWQRGEEGSWQSGKGEAMELGSSVTEKVFPFNDSLFENPSELK